MANPSIEWITVMNEIYTVNVLIKVQVTKILKAQIHLFRTIPLCSFGPKWTKVF